ncbi:hypothetical protein BMF94_5013 [Rhodotorula taiwanensis]|uniref:Uncharacterized protein n=1 Tax=Rhodotorula taiwanensis TaxID=741276 RepID=A0A2S5B5E2_9BASI|nr:hypothetical protein BMF94_5013 [Rhodotorula taiwanensis]
MHYAESAVSRRSGLQRKRNISRRLLASAASMIGATLRPSRAASRSLRNASTRSHAARPPPPLLAAAETTTSRPRPPPPKYIRFATVYPFVLLSIITSLALNLSVQRTARQVEGGRHSAQISVLEDILARLRAPANAARLLTAEEQEEIERELELVGLGRGRGKEVVSAEMSDKADKATSWKEVFLGKKGKGYEQEEDKTDWEAVFRQAEEADRIKDVQRAPQLVASNAAIPGPPALPVEQAPTPITPVPPPRTSRPLYL